jgi:hypothetical protein
LSDPYGGQHAFVFLGREDDISSIIAELQRSGDIDPASGPVYFISAFEGAFAGFAHIAQDDVPALADYLHGRLWDAGIHHGEGAVEGRWHERRDPRPTPKGPTRGLYAFIALCRIFVSQSPFQVMERIAESFGDSDPPFVGASTVIGGFHLLIELGDDDREALNGHVASLNSVPGVERVEAGFAAPGTAPG